MSQKNDKNLPYCLTPKDICDLEKIAKAHIKFDPKNPGMNKLYFLKNNYHFFSPQRITKMNNGMVYTWWHNKELVYIEDLTLQGLTDCLYFYEKYLIETHSYFYYYFNTISSKIRHEIEQMKNGNVSDESYNEALNEFKRIHKIARECEGGFTPSDFYHFLQRIYNQSIIDKYEKPSPGYFSKIRDKARSPKYFPKLNKVFDILEDFVNGQRHKEK